VTQNASPWGRDADVAGTVTDIDAVVENTSRALAQAREMSGVEPRSVVIGIAGELVKGTTASLAARRSDPRRPLDEAELEKVVERVQDDALRDAERRIGWESGIDRLDVRLVHAAIVELKIDGYPVSNPIGFTGAHLELSIFNAFAPMVHLGALQSVAAALRLQLLGVIAEPYAVATCLAPGELGDTGAVFIDVGGGTTDLRRANRRYCTKPRTLPRDLPIHIFLFVPQPLSPRHLHGAG